MIPDFPGVNCQIIRKKDPKTAYYFLHTKAFCIFNYLFYQKAPSFSPKNGLVAKNT